MRKTILSKLMALVITIMLIAASLPMAMVSASAATDDYKLTVTADSNYFPESVASYNADTKEVVVTYYWKSSKNMLDCQYNFYYDSNILSWSSKNSPITVCPTVGVNGAFYNPNCNTDADGIREGRYNATSLYLYDFSSEEKVFSQFIFDVKDGITGNIETAVTLQMVTLRVSKVDSSNLMTDGDEEVELVNFSEVIKNDATAAVAVETRTALTESTYVEPTGSVKIKFAAPTSSINRYNWTNPVLYYGNSSTYADNKTIAMKATDEKYYTAETGTSTIINGGAWTVYELTLTDAQVAEIEAARLVGFATADAVSRTGLSSAINVLKANVDSYSSTYPGAKTLSALNGNTFVICDASTATNYTAYKGYWVTKGTTVKFAAPASNTQRSTWDAVEFYYTNGATFDTAKTVQMINTYETTKVSDIGDMTTLKAGRWYIYAVTLNPAQVAEANACRKVGFAKPGDDNKTSMAKSVLLAKTDEFTGTYNTTARTLQELEGQVFVPQAKSAANQLVTFVGEWQSEAKYTEGKDDTITIYFAAPTGTSATANWDTGVELYYGKTTTYKDTNRIAMTKTSKTVAADVAGTNLTTLKSGNWTVYSAELTAEQIALIDAANNVGFIKAGSYNRTSILMTKNIARASRIENVTEYTSAKETIEAFDGFTFVINDMQDAKNERTSYLGSWIAA